jgi:LmbE family N-acetylglucosaminyl deacetylase
MGINAHPDDESSYSGTIAKFANEGHDATLVYVTSGDKGHTTIPPNELTRIREKETLNACKILGASAMFLRVPDHEIFDNYDVEHKVIEAMRKVNPNIVITHDPNDYDRDHWTTSHIVLQCVNSASLKHYKTKSPAIEKIDAVYFCDTVGGLHFDPELWIDITDTFDGKIKALKAHESQLKFMKDLFDMDMVDFHTVTASFRGMQASTKYAEAFRRFRVYPHIRASASLPK